MKNVKIMENKCTNEECSLKDKCVNYKFGTGLNWSYDPTECRNYNKFEGINPSIKKYEKKKIDKFLEDNNLRKDGNWSSEEENKIMNFLGDLKKEIIRKEMEM